MPEMQRDRIINDIEERFSLKIINIGEVTGGCIADSFYVDLSDGQRYFVKGGLADSKIFFKEGNGLRELSKSGINVPEVLFSCDDYIIMSYISEGNKTKDFFQSFGRSLAQMHKYKSDEYGFFEDNYIGRNLQVNTRKASWLEFYFVNRLLFQYKLAEKNCLADKLMSKYFINIENKLPSIIGGTEEYPCLLHGDLWAGNYMCNKIGEAVLIDPAVYYGHREADIAMTKLFGGFSDEFYLAYKEEWPLIDDYIYRERIYLLYHLLNHLNLFGECYYAQVMSTMKYYL